jgi:hypothetical protein
MGRRAALAARIALLAAGVGLLAWLVSRLGARHIAGVLAELHWNVVPILLLYAAHELSRGAALTQCVPLGHRLRLIDAVQIRLAGEAIDLLTFTGPLFSEPAKAKLLQAIGVDLKDGIASTISESLASAIAAAIFAVAGLSGLLGSCELDRRTHAVAVVALCAMALFVAASVVVLSVRRHTRIGKTFSRAALGIAGFELLAQLFLGVELWWLMSALHVGRGAIGALTIEGAAKFINVGGFVVPGQVGIAEGAYVLVFGLLKLPLAAAVAISIARRLRTLLGVSVGLAALARIRPASSASTPRELRLLTTEQ